jgi:thiol-disulfide isomerase/thioredoxin
MARSYSRISSVSSSVSSNVRSSGNKSGGNTQLYILLGILAFAIIIGTIVGSSYKSTERFSNADPKYSLIFLSMSGCHHCEDFKPVWDELMQEVKSNKTYNFTAEETIDLNSDKGSTIAKTKNITYAPAILLKENASNKTIEYDGKREINSILEFAVSNAN